MANDTLLTGDRLRELIGQFNKPYDTPWCLDQRHQAQTIMRAQEDRQLERLMSSVAIEYDPVNLAYRGRLGERNYCVASNRSLHRANEDSYIRDYIRRTLAHDLLRNMTMPNPNPHTATPAEIWYTTDNALTINPATVAIDTAAVAPPAPAEVGIPTFQLMENTQDIELRALRNEYPRQIFNSNYQEPARNALRTTREDVHTAIRRYRRIQAAHAAYVNTPEKLKPAMKLLLTGTLTGREMSCVVPNSNGNVAQTTTRRNAVQMVQEALETRRQFNTNKTQYGAIQAEYNQRAAIIRQRPTKHVTIDCEEVISTIIQWENVWGVSIEKDDYNETLKIHVGLHGITMSESAPETRYENPQDILLAPFYFTIKLNAHGYFTCPSNAARGLSAGDEGILGYDFHPHQLSDAPCFGTFGQSLIDMAHKGEIIPLVSGIIAFYSQFNSQDSAGITARTFHPANIHRIINPETYEKWLKDYITATPYYTLDVPLLEAAIAGYLDYHQATNTERPPTIMSQHYCYNCDDARVDDDHRYYLTHNDERICPDCWSDYYCDDCERHIEDCACSSE